MTPQEIFDTVATHLFTQGKRSVRLEPISCMYRASDGSKCAVGCLIPDEIYSPDFEMLSVDILLETDMLPDGPFRQMVQSNIGLLRQLQDVHDVATSWISTDYMRTSLRDISIEHGLDDSILDTLQFKDR